MSMLVIASLLIVHVPIAPELAVIVPVIEALVAVSSPALVTLNGAVEAVEPPSHSRYAGSLDESLATLDPVPRVMSPALLIVVSPPVNDVDESTHPPIAPLVAVTVPEMLASFAVTAPVLVTLNGAVDAVDPPSHKRYAGSLDESRATFSPVPRVMSPALAIVVFPPVSDVEERLHPPTVPPVAVMFEVETVPVNEPLLAVIVPVMSTPVAVRTPALVTLKGAVEAVDDPAKNGNEAGTMPTAVAPEPAVRDVAPMVNPPIWPEDADTAPVILASVAVNEPVLVTLNGAVEAVDPPSQSL